MSYRIAILGGGGAYTAGLIAVFVQRADEFKGSTLALMDIDAGHLALIERLGRRMIEAAGVDLRLQTTTDQREAIADADFVLTTFRIGGLEGRRLDEKIPLKYGIIGQETTGPGGMFMAFRTIPVVLSVARDMEVVAPSAWLLNYANPTSMVTDAVARRSGVKVIGLCDQTRGVERQIADWFREPVDPDRLFLETVGINHANWGLRLWLDGDEALADLHEQVRDLDPEQVMDAKRRYPWVLRLFKIYGLIPSPYLRYYYYHQEMVAEARAAPMTRAEEIMGQLPDILAYYEEQSHASQPRLEKRRGSTAHGDLAVDVIAAIAHNSGDRLVVNVPNRGTVDNFDDDSIVEVPALVDAAGAHPWPQGALPREVAGLIEDLKLHEELVVGAALTGSRDVALKALLASPLMRCASKAEALLDEMMAAHRDYLPQFD